MKSEDFEILKQICEKEGFEIIESHGSSLFQISKKDIWEGVEFGESMESGKIITANKIYKFISSGRDHVTIIDDLNDWAFTKITYFKPSTEQAYIEQLKTEAFKRFGEIKEGDRFDRNWISAPFNISKIGDIKNALGDGFFYKKENDELFFDSINIYRQGKWATKIPKRIKVYFYDCKTKKVNDNLSFLKCSFEIPEKSMTHNTYDIGSFLSEKLEKFLNNE